MLTGVGWSCSFGVNFGNLTREVANWCEPRSANMNRGNIIFVTSFDHVAAIYIIIVQAFIIQDPPHRSARCDSAKLPTCSCTLFPDMHATVAEYVYLKIGFLDLEARKSKNIYVRRDAQVWDVFPFSEQSPDWNVCVCSIWYVQALILVWFLDVFNQNSFVLILIYIIMWFMSPKKPVSHPVAVERQKTLIFCNNTQTAAEPDSPDMHSEDVMIHAYSRHVLLEASDQSA